MAGLVVALLTLRCECHVTHDKVKIDHDVSLVKHWGGDAEKLFVIDRDKFILKQNVEIFGEHRDKVDVEAVLGFCWKLAEPVRLATFGDESPRIFEKLFIILFADDAFIPQSVRLSPGSTPR